RFEHYKQEAMALDAAHVYSELEKHSNVIRLKSKNGSVLLDPTDEDLQKVAGYMGALEARRHSEEPEAAHFWANANIRLCGSLEKIKAAEDSAKECFAETMEGFMVASKGGIPGST